MREELREMIRIYEKNREPPREALLGVPFEAPRPDVLALMTVTLERYRAHFTPEEEIEYLKELDHFTRLICESRLICE